MVEAGGVGNGDGSGIRYQENYLVYFNSSSFDMPACFKIL